MGRSQRSKVEALEPYSLSSRRLGPLAIRHMKATAAIPHLRAKVLGFLVAWQYAAWRPLPL